MDLKLSICVPVYEMKGKGAYFLYRLLETIHNQSYNNYEVVVSDHSIGEELKNVCSRFNRIVYLKNEEKRGSSSANINNAIKNSNGDIIKPIFQDDFFSSRETFSTLTASINESDKWGATGFNHIYGNDTFRYAIPYYNNNIINGVNTIGAPSTVFFREKFYFDENLIWFMDCEFYHRLYLKFGNPKIINDCCVTIDTGDHSISSSITEEIIEKEKKYIKNLYGI
jgi:glycosyltransferase involved in cell wall biosynthesis